VHGPDQTLLAIDVAVMLPVDLRRRVARLNGVLTPPPDGFRLDDTHVPHITIVQLFVRAHHLEELSDVVGTAVQTVEPLELRTASIDHGRTATTLQVALTPQLERLHRGLMDDLRPFEAGPGTTEAFVVDGELPREADLAWVGQFRTHAAYDLFEPHVTLGVGGPIEPPPATSFTATEVAIYHLGRFCTCRRLVRRWELAVSKS
jgi:hypothetical protein